MPSGRVHLSFWKSAWFLPIAVAGAFFIPLQWKYTFTALGILFGYGLGYYIDPDLDLVGTTSAEGRMLQIPIIGILLVSYWTIYGGIFRKQHRSFWTHSYVVSTAIRFAFMFWWMIFIPSMHMLLVFGLMGCFIGLCISDGVHIWADNRFGGK